MINSLEYILPETGYSVSFEQLNTIATFQRLWSDMANWMRSFIISVTFDLPNLTITSNQLYNTAEEFYKIFSSYYGPDLSRQFVSLLSNFIISGMRLVEGIKDGNQELINTSTAKWYEDANALSSFLERINVYWDSVIWNNFFHQYIRAKIDEVIAITNGDYEREVDVFNRIQDLTLLMGRYMARGIMAASLLNPSQNQE